MELTAKTYKVVGALRVFETKPGDTFTAALPAEQEQLLIEGGHIEIVSAAPAAPAGDTPEPDTTSSQDGETDEGASDGDDTDGDEQDHQSGAAPAGERS